MTATRRTRLNMEAIKGDMERQIENIDLWYLKMHLKEMHINKSDRFLMKRITKEGLSEASSFLTKDENILFDAILKALNDEGEKSSLLYFLAVPREQWGPITEEHPEGTSWIIDFDLPEGVIGHLFKRSHTHNWRDGAIVCTQGSLIISRNVRYAEDMLQCGESQEDPFILKTAYAVD